MPYGFCLAFLYVTCFCFEILFMCEPNNSLAQKEMFGSAWNNCHSERLSTYCSYRLWSPLLQSSPASWILPWSRSALKQLKQPDLWIISTTWNNQCNLGVARCPPYNCTKRVWCSSMIVSSAASWRRASTGQPKRMSQMNLSNRRHRPCCTITLIGSSTTYQY